MKQHLVVIGSCLLFITLCFSGCEFLSEKDYITVNVTAHILVILYDINGNVVQNDTADDVLVYIWMTKDDGERITFDKYTENGATSVSGSFKLYREQHIDVSASVVTRYKAYQTGWVDTSTLTWDTVYGAADFGGTYNWDTDVMPDMRMQPEE